MLLEGAGDQPAEGRGSLTRFGLQLRGSRSASALFLQHKMENKTQELAESLADVKPGRSEPDLLSCICGNKLPVRFSEEDEPTRHLDLLKLLMGSELLPFHNFYCFLCLGLPKPPSTVDALTCAHLELSGDRDPPDQLLQRVFWGLSPSLPPLPLPDSLARNTGTHMFQYVSRF